jgi:hypothetical protein
MNVHLIRRACSAIPPAARRPRCPLNDATRGLFIDPLDGVSELRVRWTKLNGHSKFSIRNVPLAESDRNRIALDKLRFNSDLSCLLRPYFTYSMAFSTSG